MYKLFNRNNLLKGKSISWNEFLVYTPYLFPRIVSVLVVHGFFFLAINVGIKSRIVNGMPCGIVLTNEVCLRDDIKFHIVCRHKGFFNGRKPPVRYVSGRTYAFPRTFCLDFSFLHIICNLMGSHISKVLSGDAFPAFLSRISSA